MPARLRGGLASPGPADPERHLPLVRPRGPRGAEVGPLGAEAAPPGACRAGLGGRRGIRRARAGAGDRGRPLPGAAAAACGASSGAEPGAGGRALPHHALAHPGRRRSAASPPGASARGVRAHRGDRPPLLFGARHLLRLPLPLLRRAGDRPRGAHRPRSARRGRAAASPPRPARSPLPPRGRASGRWRSATRCTLPSRRARDAPGPRPAARSWRRSWRARGWTPTARPATASRRLVQGWLSSELRAELEAGGARIRPEVPFALGLGGAVVRGKIDLLAELPEGPLVVDYKTDALRGSDPAELAERYETQRDLYALAVHGARRNGGAANRSRRLLLPRGPRSARRSRPTTRPGPPRRASASSASSRGSAPATSSAPTAHTPRSATAARRRRGCARSPPGGPSGQPRRAGAPAGP